MALNPHSAIAFTWEALGVFWLLGYFFTKPTVRAQPAVSRLFYIALACLGSAFLGTSWFDRGWLALRFVPPNRIFGIAGFLVTLAGTLFAAWARIALGSNWSGRPSVKAGHELVVKGPYALARHPIYTGILLAAAGTSFAFGQWRCVIGFILLSVAFAIKVAQEERLMLQAFPDAYPAYRKRVRALIPGLL